MQGGMFSRKVKPSATMIGARRKQEWFAGSLVTKVGSCGTPLAVNLVPSHHLKQEGCTDVKEQKGASSIARTPPGMDLVWTATAARGQE